MWLFTEVSGGFDWAPYLDKVFQHEGEDAVPVPHHYFSEVNFHIVIFLLHSVSSYNIGVYRHVKLFFITCSRFDNNLYFHITLTLNGVIVLWSALI